MEVPEATLLKLVEEYIEWRREGYEPNAALSIIHHGSPQIVAAGSQPRAPERPPEPWTISSYANYLLKIVHVKHGGLNKAEINEILRKYLNAYKLRGACEGIQKSSRSDREKRLNSTKKSASARTGGWRTKIECQRCGQRIGVRTADLGTSAPCPNCATTLDIREITQRCVPLREVES